METKKAGLPPSRYINYFVENREAFAEQFELVGDVVLVERIKFPEPKTASGLIIASMQGKQIDALTADPPVFYRVLLPGAGFYNDETGEDAPLNCQMGDIVLAAQGGVRMFPTLPLVPNYDPATIGVTRDSEILWRFKGQEAFEKFVVGFDSATAAEVAKQRAAGTEAK